MEVSDVRVALEPWFDRVLLVYGPDAIRMLTHTADRGILRRALRMRQAARGGVMPTAVSHSTQP